MRLMFGLTLQYVGVLFVVVAWLIFVARYL
jgi:hypothetical protein